MAGLRLRPVDKVEASASVRLAELLAALSLGIDLGFGQPMEHVLRQCRIALRLGELVGLDEQTRATLYYTALLVNVGCHTDAHEQARWCGDDIAVKATKYDHEQRSLAEVAAMIRMIGSGNPPMHRLRVAFDFATSGHRDMDGMIEQHAQMARALGEELRLPQPVLEALGASYERWDGRGWPGTLSGDDIPLASRITQFAEFLEVAHRSSGIDAARDLATRRAGKQFDPNLTAVLGVDAEKVFHDIDEIGSWDAVIDAEPALAVELSAVECDAALAAIARYVDLKSPYTLGHSKGVADLAARAGEGLGLGSGEVQTLRRAGLVLGFGRLGVSNGIWDKRGPLTAGEWERVRMHPYLTERILRQSPALSPLGAIAAQHRERLDGSGYPNGSVGGAIGRAARVVGAADAYQAMREPRPHRPALRVDTAAAELRADVTAGRLDGESVEAVLDAAGHRTPRRRTGPAGLTPREIDVLRLVARGMSNKEIAAELVITPRTAGNHIEHIYTKIGVSKRAAASLFAMQNGLIPEESLDPTE
jgi:HD-GYP domain-containing protein (c-di-GMP phosphodiesterase class II)